MRFKQFQFLFLTISVCIAACQKVDIQFGNQVLDNQYTQVVRVDTFTVNLSTINVDSFPTSGSGVTLLGGYTDTSFGRIDTKCFFDLAPPTYEKVYDSTIFNSLILILKLDKNYYGDTSKPLHIDVSRLKKQILFPQNTYSFYNVDSFPVYPTTIGSGDYLVHPTFYTDSISIPLDKSLGQELLKKLKNPLDLDLQTTNNFLNYFNGIRLSSNASTNLILNCSDNIIMRLSYSKPGPDTLEQHHIDFTLNNREHHFNKISVDRSKLTNGLQNLSHNDSIIPSKKLNNRAYSQYASGVMTKMTFPTLPNLLKVPYYSKILTAELKIVPVRGTYDTYYYLPPSLNLQNTNLTNNFGGAIVQPGTNSAEGGNLIVDYINGDNTTYSYDVSGYIKALIQSPIANSYTLVNPPEYNYGLLLVPPTPAAYTQFSRVIVGNQNQPQNFKTLLILNYLTIQPK